MILMNLEFIKIKNFCSSKNIVRAGACLSSIYKPRAQSSPLKKQQQQKKSTNQQIKNTVKQVKKNLKISNPIGNSKSSEQTHH
jgi:hypothetical protein